MDHQCYANVAQNAMKHLSALSILLSEKAHFVIVRAAFRCLDRRDLGTFRDTMCEPKRLYNIELQSWGVKSWVSSQLSISFPENGECKDIKEKILRKIYFFALIRRN